MRTAGLALALVATSQLTLLSSPAFADGAVSASVSISGSASTSSGSSASASASASGSGASATPAPASTSTTSDDPEAANSKKKTGWIVLGVGGALVVGGIVTNIVAANNGFVSGMGGGADSGQTDNTRTDLIFLGTTLLVAGIVTGVYGGSMVWSASNGTDTKASQPPEDDAQGGGATKAAQAKLASAPAFTLPLLSGKF